MTVEEEKRRAEVAETANRALGSCEGRTERRRDWVEEGGRHGPVEGVENDSHQPDSPEGRSTSAGATPERRLTLRAEDARVRLSMSWTGERATWGGGRRGGEGKGGDGGSGCRRSRIARAGRPVDARRRPRSATASRPARPSPATHSSSTSCIAPRADSSLALTISPYVVRPGGGVAPALGAG